MSPLEGNLNRWRGKANGGIQSGMNHVKLFFIWSSLYLWSVSVHIWAHLLNVFNSTSLGFLRIRRLDVEELYEGAIMETHGCIQLQRNLLIHPQPGWQNFWDAYFDIFAAKTFSDFCDWGLITIRTEDTLTPSESGLPCKSPSIENILASIICSIILEQIVPIETRTFGTLFHQPLRLDWCWNVEIAFVELMTRWFRFITLVWSLFTTVDASDIWGHKQTSRHRFAIFSAADELTRWWLECEPAQIEIFDIFDNDFWQWCLRISI